jgi:hypothetical protein
MKGKAGRILAVGFFSMFLTSMECSAQLVSSFEQLQILVKPGDNIYVKDATGSTIKGRIADLSPSSLSLVVKGQRQAFSQIDVHEIRQWRGDSLKNGALIGAAVGGGITLISFAAYPCYDCGAEVVAGVALSAGIGAAVGVGLDALIPSKQLIFFNPSRSTAGKFQIKPILNRSNKGVKVAFSF